MSLPETIQHIYEELAHRYERCNDLRLRDIFLLLAADVAQTSGRPHEAERLHGRMIAVNPNSLLRPFSTFSLAMQSLDIQDYLADLRRQFPPEEAERLLLRVRANPLGIPTDAKRAPSHYDTQELTPATGRTVNMPPQQPARRSPYENYNVPLAASEGVSWSAGICLVWFALLAALGLAWMAWTFIAPLLDLA